MGIIEGYIAKKVIDSLIGEIKKIVKNQNKNFEVKSSRIEESVNQHLKTIANWSSQVSFKDLRGNKHLSDIYLELDAYLTPLNQNLEQTEEPTRKKLIDTIEKTKDHIVLLGQPGAGKTTTVKYITNRLLTDGEFFKSEFNFPIVIRLREPQFRTSTHAILLFLYNVLGVRVESIEKIAPVEVYTPGEKIPEIVTEKRRDISTNLTQYKELLENVVVQALDDFRVLLIFDGLDEVSPDVRRALVNDIQRLIYKLNWAKVILTSRSGDYKYNLQGASEFEICSLSEKQIKKFASNWLTRGQNKKFLEEIAKTPFFDTAIRPLTIAHLCAIFDREKKLPRKPKTIYRKVVNLLLEEWDLQRSIIRQSKYQDFEPDQKFEFLSTMAFELTMRYESNSFSKSQFEAVYQSICDNFGLPKYESKKVAEELESFTGLLLQSGYDHFEFAHKSIQEYLTAEYLVRLPYLPEERALELLPNELAICIAMSTSPTNYLYVFAFEVLPEMTFSGSFLGSFFDRISLENIDFKRDPKLGLAIFQLITLQIKRGFLVEDIDIVKILYQFSSIRISLFELKQYCRVIGEQEENPGILLIDTSDLPVKRLKNAIIPNELFALDVFVEGW